MIEIRCFSARIALAVLLPLQSAAAEVGLAASGRNPAAAQALFEEAQRRVAAGDYDQACPKFKASYTLDPAGGTLLNLADCLEKQGRTASAWSTFKDAQVLAQRDGRAERVEYAQQHIRALEAKLSYLTVEVPASSQLGGLSLQVDGTPLAAAAWGTPLPVDPGGHTVRAEAPGFEPLEQRVAIGGASAREIFTLPSLRALPPSEPAAVEPAPAMLDGDASPSARTWAWVTGGVGLAALGVGSYFGLKAFSRWSDRNAACVGGCTPAAKQAGEDASRAATLATIGVGGGALLVGTAALLFFSSGESDPGPESAAALALTPTEGGASVHWGGHF